MRLLSRLVIQVVQLNPEQRIVKAMTDLAAKRTRKSLSKALQIAIYRRDAWLCRWCKRPVTFAPAMKLLGLEVGTAGHAARLAYHHSSWTREGAPLLDELGATIEHVKAFSTGGACSEENLCTACWKCNVRKSSAALEKWEERQKRKPIKGKYGEPKDWDGLAAVFVMLAERDPTRLTVEERQWLKALKAVGTDSSI
jgi:5-methylcytosine-specific restriction endonuclease McrA